MADSSISLLQKFINAIFIDVEIFIKENQLYCDLIKQTASNRLNHISRIRTCGQMLVALEVACWLNDPAYALQAVIYLYGLLTPLIFSKIFYPSIYQIFERCLAVGEEIASQISKQRSRLVQENIYHMIACISYYMSQYLHQNDEIKLSQLINQVGKKFLSTSTPATTTTTEPDPTGALLPDEIAEQVIPKAQQASIHNEELKALERFVARERAPHSILTGSEDAVVVYNFVNATSAKQGYKEGNSSCCERSDALSALCTVVLKFRKRTAYMEYLVQVLTKSLADCSNDDILSWYDDNQTFVNKRNELLLGPWRTIISRGEGLIAIAGSNENKYGRCSYLSVISRYSLCVCVL